MMSSAALRAYTIAWPALLACITASTAPHPSDGAVGLAYVSSSSNSPAPPEQEHACANGPAVSSGSFWRDALRKEFFEEEQLSSPPLLKKTAVTSILRKEAFRKSTLTIEGLGETTLKNKTLMNTTLKNIKRTTLKNEALRGTTLNNEDSTEYTVREALLSLLQMVSEGTGGCAVVITHDGGHDALLEKYLMQGTNKQLLKFLFNIRDMFEQSTAQQFRHLRSTTCTHHLYLVHDAALVGTVLDQLYNAEALDLKSKYTIHTQLNNSQQVLEFLKQSPLNRIVEVLMVPDRAALPLSLYTHFFFKAGTRVAVRRIGEWGGDVKASLIRSAPVAGDEEAVQDSSRDILAALFPQKLKDFDGFPFRTSTFHYPPVVILSQPPTKIAHRHDGLEMRIFYAIADALNFSARVQLPRDGDMWGSKLSNGSWSGAMGEVTRGEAEVSFANYFITADRLVIVDMTNLHSIDYACFITAMPSPPPQYTVLMRPFTSVVWLGVIISTVLMPVAFLMTAVMETGPGTWFRNVGNSSLYAWGTQMGQHLENPPQTAPLKITITSFMIASFIIAAVYRSSLFSFMLVPPEAAPVDTLQQLLHSGLQWGVRNRGGWETWFSDSSDPTSQKIYKGFQFVDGIHAGISRVLQRNFAFMNSGRFLRYITASNFTDKYGHPKLHIANQCFVPFRVGFATPRFSVYTSRFSEVIGRLVEAGLVDKWFDDIVAKAAREQRKKARAELGGVEPLDTTTDAVVLSLYHLQAAFILLCLGLGLSIAAFLLEVTVCNTAMRSVGPPSGQVNE